MKKILILLALFAFLACEQDLDSSNDLNKKSDNLLVDDQSSGTSSDPFSIISTDLDSGFLLVRISYSGGCEEHQFSMAWDGKTNSQGANKSFDVTLSHDANGDACEAALGEDLEYDLKELLDGNYSEGDQVNVINASE